MAQNNFPNKVVWFLPDFQIQGYRDTLRSVSESPRNVLILLEPIANLNTPFTIGTNDIENLIRSALVLKQTDLLNSIIIRLHPSQLDDHPLAEKLKEIFTEIEVSRSPSLLDDLKVSTAVLGFSSYGLYISSQCEIPSYSYFAGKTGHWTRYFPKVLPLST
jgi:hypothetical protein